MKALVLTAIGHPLDHFALVTDAARPAPAAHEVLVRVRATAVNPVDYKVAHYGFAVAKDRLPYALGCDGAGVVEAVGAEVSKFKVGDEVYGFPGVARPGHGTFAEFALFDDDLLAHKAASLGFDAAAALPVASETAALALFVDLGLAAPSAGKGTKENVLVWGAASAVGFAAVQLVLAAGYTPLAVCSRRNFDALRALGVQQLFDYRDADVGEQILRVTGSDLRLAFTAIGGDTNAQVAALARAPGARVATTMGSAPPDLPANVAFSSVFLGGITTSAELRAHVATLLEREIAPLVAAGRLVPLPLRKFQGLEALPEALRQVQQGLSGEKAVVLVD